MFLRINNGLRSVSGKPPFKHRFGVAVPLRAPKEDGLPTNDEMEKLNRIEDALTAAFTPSGKTLFALTITTSGFREFVFYTSVPAEIPPAMERLKKQITTHEVQFYVKPDEKWEIYKSFLQ